MQMMLLIDRQVVKIHLVDTTMVERVETREGVEATPTGFSSWTTYYLVLN